MIRTIFGCIKKKLSKPTGEKKKGLEIKFQRGDKFPWKDIWFEVNEVGYDYLILIPKYATAGYVKRKRKESQYV